MQNHYPSKKMMFNNNIVGHSNLVLGVVLFFNFTGRRINSGIDSPDSIDQNQ